LKGSDTLRKEFSDRLASIVGQECIEALHQIADISAQISKARREQNISQQKLADLIGVAKSTIGRIEAGLTQPRSSTLYKISDVLNIPLIIDGTTGKESDDHKYRHA
jgi:DNA-binding XRE family transcriptional regulator